MRKTISQGTEKMSKENAARILYTFDNEDTYLENIIGFISEGLGIGDHVLIVESKRNIPQLRARLKSILNTEEQSRVHYVNNYDYFFLNGSFHASAIYNYFASLEGSLQGKENSFRTWMHVEWGHEQELIRQIERFKDNTEKMADQQGMVSVYAYNSEWLNRDLEARLQECHTRFLTDCDFYVPDTSVKK